MHLEAKLYLNNELQDRGAVKAKGWSKEPEGCLGGGKKLGYTLYIASNFPRCSFLDWRNRNSSERKCSNR